MKDLIGNSIMKKESRILIPPENYVADVAKKMPRSQLDKLIAMFGANVASVIMETFAGRAIHIPNKSTLFRVACIKYIRQELKGIPCVSKKFNLNVRKLSMFYGKSKRKIVRIWKTGRYK